jgi:hypothetical protein
MVSGFDQRNGYSYPETPCFRLFLQEFTKVLPHVSAVVEAT